MRADHFEGWDLKLSVGSYFIHVCKHSFDKSSTETLWQKPVITEICSLTCRSHSITTRKGRQRREEEGRREGRREGKGGGKEGGKKERKKNRSVVSDSL